MSMKRILGMMLASRMAGRGMRGGVGRGGFAGGGLGGLAAAGVLGGRRGGFGRKAGLAALGYLAYRAYQDHQQRSASSPAGSTASERQASAAGKNAAAGDATSGGGIGGALGGLIKSVGDALSGSNAGGDKTAAVPTSSTRSADQPYSIEDERDAELFSEDTALLLLRGMIAAANADGTISPDERSRIMNQAETADAEERQTLERELATPRPLDELLPQVKDPQTAAQFYLASRMAIDGASETNQNYIRRLRERLGLAEQEAQEIDALAS